MGRRRNNPADTLPRDYYRKGQNPTIYFWYEDETGKRVSGCSRCTDLAGAKAVRASVIRDVRQNKQRGLISDGPLLTKSYSERWVAERERRNKGNARFHRDNIARALPVLGALPLEDVKHRHLRDMMRDLMAAETLAPRTMLHTYSSVKAMFRDAVIDELIDASPCTLRAGEHGELPVLEDADREWRDRAVFDLGEILALVADPRIHHVRRMAYGLGFLSAMRGGEEFNRRWRDYNAGMKPLGELRLNSAWSHENQKEKSPKNKIGRALPVHPFLASMLAEWKLSGWAREYGRTPADDDFIIATPWPRGRDGERLAEPPASWTPGQRVNNPRTLWRWLNGQWRKSGKRTPGDLALLGLRPRRAYDTRRTFISLAVADGAREVVLRHITHGRPRKSAFDLYKSFPWDVQCEEVKKLRLVQQHEAERGRQ